MADAPSTSTPIPAHVPTAEHLDYRPISPWAVAGFSLGLFFALVVLGSFLFAVYSGAPFYLPGWVVVLALVGAAVSFAAERMVRASEGSRAGETLARWGMWLGVFSGLGYFAFSYFTLLALSNQAHAFLMTKDEVGPDGTFQSGFFPRLLSGDRAEINRAFLLTLPRSHRSGNPADEREMAMLFDVGGDARGRLSQFREHWLVKELVYNDPSQVHIQPLGIQKWDFDKGSYHVVRHYRIKTPERTLEVSLPVQSNEPSEEGERRSWFVALNSVGEAQKQQTDLGTKLQGLRNQIYLQIITWYRGLPANRLEDTTVWEKVIPLDAHRAAIRPLATQTLEGNPVAQFYVLPAGQETFPWKQVDGKLQMSYPVRLVTMKSSNAPGYNIEGLITVESSGPVNLDDPGRPTWQLRKLEWLRASVVPDPIAGKGPPPPPIPAPPPR